MYFHNPKSDAYDQTASKTWGKDELSLKADFPWIQAELTPSRTLTRTDNTMLYSCHGGDATFFHGNFQNAQRSCKSTNTKMRSGIRSFLNDAGIDFIESTPKTYHSWTRLFNMIYHI